MSSSSSSAADASSASAAPNEIDELKAKRTFVEDLISKKTNAAKKKHCQDNEEPYGSLFMTYDIEQLKDERKSLSQEIIAIINSSGRHNHIHINSPAHFSLSHLRLRMILIALYLCDVMYPCTSPSPPLFSYRCALKPQPPPLLLQVCISCSVPIVL